MSDKCLDHHWRCSVYAEERNDAGVMVSVIAGGQEQHDASSDWRVSSAKRWDECDVLNCQDVQSEDVQSVGIPMEAHG